MNTLSMMKTKQKSVSFLIPMVLSMLIIVNGSYASLYFVPNTILWDTSAMPLWIKGGQILFAVLNIVLIAALWKKYKIGLFGLVFTSALSFFLCLGVGLEIKHAFLMGANLIIALPISIPFWKSFSN